MEALYALAEILLCCAFGYGTLVLMGRHMEQDEELPRLCEHCSDDDYTHEYVQVLEDHHA